MPKNSATIAVLADEYQEYGKLLVDQMARVFNDAGYGLVCITGKELDPEQQFHQNYAVCNSIYTASHDYDLAGMVLLLGGLSINATEARTLEFISQFPDIPMVSYGRKLTNMSSVVIDERCARQEMYTQAFEHCTAEKIAFVKGKTLDIYSQNREKCFRDVARANGFSEEAILSVEGNYNNIESYDGVIDLLNEHPDIGLIAAANDTMAESTVRAIQAKGLRVPDDILVTGFDDTQEATRVFPAISTVRQPLSQASIECALALLDCISASEQHDQEYRPLKTEVSAEFIERGSTAAKVKQKLHESLDKHAFIDQLQQAMLGLEPPETICMERLCETLWLTIEAAPIEFEHRLLALFEASAPTLQSVHWWTNLCFQIENICNQIAHNKNYYKVCTLVTAAVTAVRTRIWDTSLNNEFDKLRTSSVRTEMQLQMSSCVEEDEILDTMSRWLHKTNISRCYLVRYAHPGPLATKTACLLYAYEKSSLEQRPAYSFSTNHLLPEQYAHVVKKGLTVQTPIYAGNYLYGYLLVDPSGMDFLYLDSAAQSIGNAMRNQHLIKQLEQQAKNLQNSNQELVKLANFDELTTLPNRLQFNEFIKSFFERSKTKQHPLTLLFIDLDGFKIVNDTLGHRAGDELLKQVASRLKSSLYDQVADNGFIARLGGDEFTISLTSEAHTAQAETIANEILSSLSAPYTISERTINISASIGLASFPEHADSAESLIKNADSAMYRAKEKGKNQVAWYTTELNVFGDTLLQMDNDMRIALLAGDICMHYQPRVNIDTGDICAVEALMRWTIETPEGNRVRTRPDIFIPIAEKTGFITKLDAFALDEACRQAKYWELTGTPLLVAVNISVLHLQQDDFVETVTKALDRHELPPALLELEITESAMMTQVDNNVKKLHSLRKLGIQLSIDDFGTGYSSLSYLKQLPVNNLKIDKSFISDISSLRMRRSADAAIVKSVIALGRSMDFQIIAEGIETEQQRQFLRSLGCHEAQGYLFAHPSPAAEITKLLVLASAQARSA